jgi:hypothetical protein
VVWAKCSAAENQDNLKIFNTTDYKVTTSETIFLHPKYIYTARIVNFVKDREDLMLVNPFKVLILTFTLCVWLYQWYFNMSFIGV